jgi:anti-sigma-K factor RskA
MTPSDSTAKHSKSALGRKTELAQLIEACGRDERPALEQLYALTAPTLFALARRATEERGAAEQALLQAYLAIFEDAGRFDPATDDPAAWLRDVLIRHLPSLPPASKSGTLKPVAPPAELWQRLDIALGLKRLDRHIKPGIATQERGRDPMPNDADRRVDRQIRFWRATSGVALVALTASIALLALLLTQTGRLDPWARSAPNLAAVYSPQTSAADPAAGPTTAAVSQPAEAAETGTAGRSEAATQAAAASSAAPRRAILQPSDESRLWHVVLDGNDLQVDAMPPFTAPAEASGKNVLTLWAVADNGAAMHRLAELDPAGTTKVALPDEVDAKGLGFVVSLEPKGGPAADRPQGPVLFAGQLQP